MAQYGGTFLTVDNGRGDKYELAIRGGNCYVSADGVGAEIQYTCEDLAAGQRLYFRLKKPTQYGLRYLIVRISNNGTGWTASFVGYAK